MTSRTPFRHPHWEVINRAELDVCTPSSFGGSKARTQKELRLLVWIDRANLLANIALCSSSIVTSSAKQNWLFSKPTQYIS